MGVQDILLRSSVLLDFLDDTLSTDLVRIPQTIVKDIGLTDGIIARQGCTVIVPFREEMAKRHLKVAGDLGRVIFMVRGKRCLGEIWLILGHRNMISETHHPWRKVFDIQTSSTTSLAACTLRSESKSSRRTGN